MERQSKGLRGLEAYCKGGPRPTTGCSAIEEEDIKADPTWTVTFYEPVCFSSWLIRQSRLKSAPRSTNEFYGGGIVWNTCHTRLRFVKSTSTLLVRLNIQGHNRFSVLKRQHGVIIWSPLGALSIPTCDPSRMSLSLFTGAILNYQHYIYSMYITSVQLDTF